MSKWRKKPVVIEAVQLLWMNQDEIREFADVGKLVDGKPEWEVVDGYRIVLSIPTLEGVMLANDGDWIIKGVEGELYPCKPDIFDKTYEAVEDEEVSA